MVLENENTIPADLKALREGLAELVKDAKRAGAEPEDIIRSLVDAALDHAEISSMRDESIIMVFEDALDDRQTPDEVMHVQRLDQY